jgi:hypothetical protein
MTISTKRPRERVYLISCLEQNTGGYIFFAIDDFSKMIFPLGAFESISELTYEEVIRKLTKDETFNQQTGSCGLVVGFGREVCQRVKPELAGQDIHISYNPDMAIDNAWEVIMTAFSGNLNFNLKPVSLEFNKINTWTRFLDLEFVKKFIPEFNQLPEAGRKLIADFKTHFPEGIDHVSFVDTKAGEKVFTQQNFQSWIPSLFEIPNHNGIVYIDIGNGKFSDFVYRFTNADGWVNIVCFREQDGKEGIVVGSFALKGSMELRTPTGMNDLLNTSKLIALIKTKKELLKGIHVNFNPEAVGVNHLDKGRVIIPISKFLYVTYNG